MCSSRTNLSSKAMRAASPSLPLPSWPKLIATNVSNNSTPNFPATVSRSTKDTVRPFTSKRSAALVRPHCTASRSRQSANQCAGPPEQHKLHFPSDSSLLVFEHVLSSRIRPLHFPPLDRQANTCLLFVQVFACLFPFAASICL